MKIPDNMSEDEVLAVIETIARRLAYKYKFGYHDIDDMKQQARLEAWKGLADYDGKRPLENFLWTHVRNRLYNFKRDKFERPDKPCLNCPLNAYIESEDGCGLFNDKMECELYSGWINRNSRKRNIMTPIAIGSVVDEHEPNMKKEDNIVDILTRKEIIEILDREIPIEFRGDYLRLKFGTKVSKSRRVKMREVVTTILEEHGINVEEAW